MWKALLATAVPIVVGSCFLLDPFLGPSLTLDDGDPLIIALIGDESEAIAAGLFAEMEDALEMAIDDQGAVAGHQVTVVAFDTRCTDTEGTSVARQVVDHGRIVGVIGPMCSASARTALPTLEADEVVSVSPSATSADLPDFAPDTFNRAVLNEDQLTDAGLADDHINGRQAVVDFYAEFETYRGAAPTDATKQYLAYAYDATRILLEATAGVAAERVVGGITIRRRELAEAVRETTNYSGITGTISFKTNGDLVEP